MGREKGEAKRDAGKEGEKRLVRWFGIELEPRKKTKKREGEKS